MPSLTTLENRIKTALARTTYKTHILLTLLKFRSLPSSTLSLLSSYKTWLYHERDLLVSIQKAFDKPRMLGSIGVGKEEGKKEGNEGVWLAIQAWMVHQADGKSLEEDVDELMTEMHHLAVSRTFTPSTINTAALTPQQLALLSHLREKYQQYENLPATLNDTSQDLSKPAITEEERQESISLAIQGLSILCHHSTALPQREKLVKKSVILRREMVDSDIEKASGELPRRYRKYGVEEVMWYAERCGLIIGQGGQEKGKRGVESSTGLAKVPTRKKTKEQVDEEADWSLDEQEFSDNIRISQRKAEFDAKVLARQKNTSAMAPKQGFKDNEGAWWMVRP
ncbi:hypothetical protein BJ875DRAFT_128999 [Amylocarpus encephaloides]|uniref:Uncharacterized protein n=1 Tax=Amylocarpus encephaloides TaxID=45428 RepID=A0A9P8C2J9_9HELO|nr:hypothetical protein BJ875DRAFT_128999 [Amylocarpus encephaloides]